VCVYVCVYIHCMYYRKLITFTNYFSNSISSLNDTYTEKNGLVGLNSNSDEKQTNQNFLVKFIRILVETRLLINNYSGKNKKFSKFTRNIVTRIPVISTRILINLIKSF